MDFSLSLEQKMLVETVREFITSELQPLEEEIEHSGKLDPDLAEDIKNKSLQLGLFAMNVPKTFGGGGADNPGLDFSRRTVRSHNRHPHPESLWKRL